MEARKDEGEGGGGGGGRRRFHRLRCQGLLLLLGSCSEGSSTFLAPIRRADGFRTALQTLGKVSEEMLIVFFLYWPQIPQISLPIWKLPVSRFESAARFDRTKLGSPDRLDRATWFRSIRSEGVFWFFCRSWFCPIEPSFARSTRSGDLVSIGQIYQALLLLLCRYILSDRDGLARSTRSGEAKFVRSTLFFLHFQTLALLSSFLWLLNLFCSELGKSLKCTKLPQDVKIHKL